VHYRNRRPALLVLALAGLLAAGGCGNVETLADDPQRFAASGYTRYAWRRAALPEPRDYRDTRQHALDVSLRDAVDERLGELGYRRVEKDAAEFLIDYVATPGVVDGQLSRNANNVTPLPSGTINRQINQAEVDNAYALAGARTTGNIALLFVTPDQRRLWSVRLKTLVEDANRVNPARVRRAMREGMRSLPRAAEN